VKRTKKPSPIAEFLDVLADVIADRLATRLAEASKEPPMPKEVPLWQSGPRLPRGRRHPPVEGKWTLDSAFRNAGLLKYGDPGYDAAFQKYLEWQRKHATELRGRAQMRKAVKLFEKLLQGAKPRKAK
jgi:hypothetical protein